MHGPPLTVDEIAAMLACEVAALRQSGARLGVAVEVVAERNDVPTATVRRLLVRRRWLEKQAERGKEAVA